MFGTLLRFLETFPGAPVLLMTATMQPARKLALQRTAAALGMKLEEIFGPPDLEQLPRYRVQEIDREGPGLKPSQHLSVVSVCYG